MRADHTKMLQGAELVVPFKKMLRLAPTLGLAPPKAGAAASAAAATGAAEPGAGTAQKGHEKGFRRGGGGGTSGQHGGASGGAGAKHGASPAASPSRQGRKVDEAFPAVTTPMIEGVLKELWGAGGPLNNMALGTASRAELLATQSGGYLAEQRLAILERLHRIFLVPQLRSTPWPDKLRELSMGCALRLPAAPRGWTPQPNL